MDTTIDKEVKAILVAALDGSLTEDQADRLAEIDAHLLKLALLAAARRIAELRAKLDGPAKIDPATPSGQRPVYTKPAAPRRKGKPGAKPGHPGSRRPAPQRIDEHKEHRMDCCPRCGGELQRSSRTRSRTIEDILEDLRTVVTEHTIHRDYCPACKKHVEPPVPDALPNATLGHRAVALSAWLHYGVGVSISQVQELLGGQFQTHLSAGGLVAAWQRLAVILEPWYVQLAEQAKASAYLHADETGWRMNGHTWWLWCFANRTTCYYLIDPSRGGPALERFFAEAFDGVLITDFWPAYNAFATERQCCLVHLLRELEKVDEHNASGEWQAFAKKLRGHDPLATIVSALRAYPTDDRLPPLPIESVADG